MRRFAIFVAAGAFASLAVGSLAPAAPSSAARPHVAPPPSVELVEVAAGRTQATFSMRPERPESAVFLAGDFNGWNPAATRMERMGDGYCRTTVELADGRHAYKFVVDGAWIADPRNPEREPDGHDGFNSVLVIGGEPAFDASSARVGDGTIEVAACRHDPSRAMWLQREPDGATLVRYRALAGDVESVALVLDGTPPQPMGHVTRVGGFDWWQIRIPRGHEDTPYGFVVIDGATNWADPSAFRVPG
ncbi:MAG: hypothetical protein ACO3QC_13525, partial [Phycisphaerales bacterium]